MNFTKILLRLEQTSKFNTQNMSNELQGTLQFCILIGIVLHYIQNSVFAIIFHQNQLINEI